MKFKSIILTAPLLLILAAGCNNRVTTPPKSGADTYKPVYESEVQNGIKSEDPRDLSNPGKIYFAYDRIYINEREEGVHIIDNTDPKNPQKVKFIAIPGNIDIAVKGNVLYADNFSDLVAIDISDLNDVKELYRYKGAYHVEENAYPPYTNVFFFCAEKEKGNVAKWVKAEYSDEAKCYR